MSGLSIWLNMVKHHGHEGYILSSSLRSMRMIVIVYISEMTQNEKPFDSSIH